ncbi:MAG TPA: hypothetical protein VII12_03220 [Thermoanaerobaculia bacterium]
MPVPELRLHAARTRWAITTIRLLRNDVQTRHSELHAIAVTWWDSALRVGGAVNGKSDDDQQR